MDKKKRKHFILLMTILKMIYMHTSVSIHDGTITYGIPPSPIIGYLNISINIHLPQAANPTPGVSPLYQRV